MPRKTSKLPPHRQAVVDVLNQRLPPKLAIKFESQIWDMCVNLSKDYTEGPEEIYTQYAYEKVGEILHVREEEYDNIVQDLKKSTIDWDSFVYDKFRNRIILNNDQLIKGNKVEKGEFQCRNRECGSKECYFYQQQDRSGDEGMTVYVVCTKCSTRYRFN